MTDAKYAKAISPAGISCGAQLVEKASQSFAPYGRERDCNHFRRRRVRRRKYFGFPMSANRTHRERRSSEMTELSALAGSEGYAACDDEAQCRIVRLWRTTEARSAAPVPIGRLWTPRSAECTSWERRSSEMTELSALAVSEGYAACDDDGGLYCQKRPSRAFFDSLSPAGISCGADSIFRFTRSRQGRPRGSAPLRRRAPGEPSPRPGTARTRRCPSRSSRRPARRYPAARA